MPTLFTCPKPFEGDTAVYQRNAIRSWTRLPSEPEILLVGDDAGVAEFAEEHDLRHIPDIETNEHGTPRVDSIFLRAQQEASQDVLCYVNADIILLDGLTEAIERTLEERPRSLVAGRRWNVELDEELDFEDGWEKRLRERVRAEGFQSGPDAIDYFAFQRGTFEEIPPFAIGRFAWDNWLLYDAKQRDYDLVDVTALVDVIHHVHDYSTTSHEDREAEIERNMELLEDFDPEAGGEAFQRLRTLRDADYRMTEDGLKRNRSPARAWTWLLEKSEDHPSLRPLIRGIKRARSAYRSAIGR